jgi:GT2 family glycosyltransferase
VSDRVPGRVSIVVAAHDAQETLPRCLEALHAQDHGDTEVIVIDDGSSDATSAVAAGWLGVGAVTVVRCALNRGVSVARNLGLEHASGEIVAFIDSDGYAAPDWASELLRAFADRTVGAVASTVFFADEPLVLNGAGGTVDHAGWGKDIALGEPYSSAELEREVLYAMGCGLAVRGEVADAIGPFDAAIRNYYDDTEFCLRVWRAGWRVVVADRAWIDHDFGPLTRPGPRKQLLCERHRMRVVLTHRPARALPGWALREWGELRRASSPTRELKLAAMRWNLARLPGVLRARRRLHGAPQPPARLFRDARGAGPEQVEHEGALLYGWHGSERDELGPFRWSGRHGALRVRVPRRGSTLRVRYRLPPWPVGEAAVTLLGVEPAREAPAWSAPLCAPPDTWHEEAHDLDVPEGEYVLLFTVGRARADPPEDERELGIALRGVTVQ